MFRGRLLYFSQSRLLNSTLATRLNAKAASIETLRNFWAKGTKSNIAGFRRYTSGTAREKYLVKREFRVADRITLWRIVLRGLDAPKQTWQRLMRAATAAAARDACAGTRREIYALFV